MCSHNRILSAVTSASNDVAGAATATADSGNSASNSGNSAAYIDNGPADRVGPTFDERLLQAINDAGLMLMCSIGHRTGLLDTMATNDWADPEEIAKSAGLNARYVREWLGAMAMGGIVEVNADETFRLPAEHARFLTRAAGSDNFAVYAQYIGLLGGVEDDIVECFRHGGGVPYERFGRFHEVMAEDSGLTVLEALDEHILPLIPDVQERLREGIEVLDVGCGRGRAVMKMAEEYPDSRFVGIDLSESAIEWAQKEAQKLDLDNVQFEQRDATDFDVTAESEAFDFVTTFDAVHDQAQPLSVLKGIARTLRSDGVYLMQDIHAHTNVHDNTDHPLGALLYTVSCMHCMTVSLAQDGVGLGAMWGREQAVELLREAGFSRIEINQLDHDPQNDYYVVRKS